jgi:hypothetical protein
VISAAAIAALATLFNPKGGEPELPPVKPAPEAAEAVAAAREWEWRIARATIEEGGATSPVLIVQALLGLHDVAEGPLLEEIGAALRIPDGRSDVARAASAQLRKGAEPGRTALMTIWPIISEEQAAREMAHYANFELIMLKNPGAESVKTVKEFLQLPNERIELDKDTPHFLATQGSFSLDKQNGFAIVRAAIPSAEKDWDALKSLAGEQAVGGRKRTLRGRINPILLRSGLPLTAEGEADLRYLSTELRGRPLGDWLQWLRVEAPAPAEGEAVILVRDGRPIFVESAPRMGPAARD